MALTPEEQAAFEKLRNDLQNLKTAFDNFARDVGVDPHPAPIMPVLSMVNPFDIEKLTRR
jgi:hypothetical protein